MEGNVYGYIRVSTKEQNEDRQRIAMKKFGIPEQRIYFDKQSGMDFNRPGYQKLMKKLRPNDTFVIKSIDRLGRNYDEILEQWRYITQEKKAGIIVLDMPLLETETECGLMGKLIAEIMLHLLCYVAETERENIRQRQAEGIAAAKARGVKFGRRELPIPEGFEQVRKLWGKGEISGRQAAKLLGVEYRTFKKWCGLRG